MDNRFVFATPTIAFNGGRYDVFCCDSQRCQGGPRVTPPPCLRLLEPVALAVQLQNMDMMREAIEKRASETLATEDGGPFLEWKIRRDDGRATFVTLAEYFLGSVLARLPSAWAKATHLRWIDHHHRQACAGQARRNHRLSIRRTRGRDHATVLHALRATAE
jgi:hypothetical protein